MSSRSNAESSAIPSRATSSLQRRFLLGAGLGGAALILALAWAGDVALDRFARRESDTTLSDAAQRGQLLVDQLLADRERQAGVLALTPAVVEAAREGGARAAGLNIAATPAADLEQRFSLERSLQASPATRTFLVGVLPRLDAAEITLTEAHGFNAVTTRRVGDFVQSDEGWWQAAWQDGFSSAGAVYDSTLRRSFVSVAAVVKDGGTRLGVLALSFNAAPLVDARQHADEEGARGGRRLQGAFEREPLLEVGGRRGGEVQARGASAAFAGRLDDGGREREHPRLSLSVGEELIDEQLPTLRGIGERRIALASCEAVERDVTSPGQRENEGCAAEASAKQEATLQRRRGAGRSGGAVCVGA
jgi:hypothetical protein